MSNFAKNIRFLRFRTGFPWPQWSRLLGLTEDEIKAVERGQAVTPDTILRISDGLGISADRLLRQDLIGAIKEARSKDIRLFLFDIDGTMTDGGVYYSEHGDVSKRFNVQDGMAIHRLITRKGFEFGFITAGMTGAIIRNRAKTLGVKRVYVGKKPKTEVIDEWLKELEIGYENLAYVGDDVNDLPVFHKAGLTACPANAVEPIKQLAHIQLRRKGGEGAIREFLTEVLGHNIDQ